MIEKIRKTENFHVLLWLIKDCFWMMDIESVGTFMVFPTILMAIYVCYISRKEWDNLLPNLAVLCWICANSLWMLFDFYQWQLKPFSLFFFVVGFISILVYVFKLIIKNKPKI